jgi:hypothetical protein
MENHSEGQTYRRPTYGAEGGEDHNQGLMKRATKLGGRAEEAVSDVALTVKEHPFAAFAITAGLAFAVGALWKLRTPSRKSQIEALLAGLPELPTVERIRSMWR